MATAPSPEATPKATPKRDGSGGSGLFLKMESFEGNSEPNGDQLATFDRKKGKWLRKSRRVSPYTPMSDVLSPSRQAARLRRSGSQLMNRSIKWARGVENSALPPMVRRAKQDIAFPLDTGMVNPTGVFFNTWSVSMVPFLAYVAVVTPSP